MTSTRAEWNQIYPSISEWLLLLFLAFLVRSFYSFIAMNINIISNKIVQIYNKSPWLIRSSLNSIAAFHVCLAFDILIGMNFSMRLSNVDWDLFRNFTLKNGKKCFTQNRYFNNRNEKSLHGKAFAHFLSSIELIPSVFISFAASSCKAITQTAVIYIYPHS